MTQVDQVVSGPLSDLSTGGKAVQAATGGDLARGLPFSEHIESLYLALSW